MTPDARLQIIAEDLVAEGLPAKEIAAAMHLSAAAVRSLLIGAKLGNPGIGDSAEIPPTLTCPHCGDGVFWRRQRGRPWRCRTCSRPDAYARGEWLVGGQIIEGRGWARKDQAEAAA